MVGAAPNCVWPRYRGAVQTLVEDAHAGNRAALSPARRSDPPADPRRHAARGRSRAFGAPAFQPAACERVHGAAGVSTPRGYRRDRGAPAVRLLRAPPERGDAGAGIVQAAAPRANGRSERAGRRGAGPRYRAELRRLRLGVRRAGAVPARARAPHPFVGGAPRPRRARPLRPAARHRAPAPRDCAPRARLGLPHRPPRPGHHHRLHGGDQPLPARGDQARRPGGAGIADLLRLPADPANARPARARDPDPSAHRHLARSSRARARRASGEGGAGDAERVQPDRRDHDRRGEEAPGRASGAKRRAADRGPHLRRAAVRLARAEAGESLRQGRQRHAVQLVLQDAVTGAQGRLDRAGQVARSGAHAEVGGERRAERAGGAGGRRADRVRRLRALAAQLAPALRVSGRRRTRHHLRLLPARHPGHAPFRRVHTLGGTAQGLRLVELFENCSSAASPSRPGRCSRRRSATATACA